MKINWSDLLEFFRGFVRPYIAYLFASVFAGIAVYLAIRYANDDIAKIFIIGFVEIVGIVIGFYYGSRSTIRR